ncbi:MAG: septum formation initiator family protein [Elusimicrobiales bacterium]|jgi:cell division protein FtsB|nr:septum formation initiator family protein [Elusimicrobiales bacterium]HOJ85950.1 septum formation initiator family protein [Elusimicrobiales bacterium]HOL63249.1 septum formation initiator family protein [Elusimicrobiales bacterium]HPO95713.1 septum formation initiator family protein [Elusimicrobiales bacterium]
MKFKKLKPGTKYFLIFILGFVFWIGGIYSVVSNYYHIYKLNKYKAKLEKENELLKTKIKHGDSNEFVEYNARVRLGFKKDDEIEYRFEPPGNK